MIKTFKDMYEGMAEVSNFEVGFYYGIHSKPIVTYGIDEDVNLIYCREHYIDTISMERKGGCMIFSPHDISFAVVRPTNENFNSRLIDFIIQKLKEKGIDASNDSNDIIIDGHYKVAGCTKMRDPITNRICSFLHIAITDSSELVKHICLKPRKKLENGLYKDPAGLSQWGVNEFDVEKWWLEFLDINYKKELIWAK